MRPGHQSNACMSLLSPLCTLIEAYSYAEVFPRQSRCMEIELKRGHLLWAKKEQTSKSIDIQKLFNNYWTSEAHELIVPGQLRSLTSPLISDRQTQKSLSLESIVTL